MTKENIPVFREEAPHTLYFVIQKDFKDGSLTTRFLKELETYFKIEIFVETGTHTGNTTEKASEIFSTVHSIELFPEFYAIATQRFRQNNRVHLHFGDSADLLSSILPSCQKKALFYLDGHYDGGERSGKGENYTPILKELAAIQAWGRTDSIIVIDDICDFQESVYPERIAQSCFANYPDLKRVIDEILVINPHYQICFIPNALLAFPPCASVTVSSLLSACTVDRLSAISDLFSEEEILRAESAISSAQGLERRELESYFQAYSNFEWDYGWRSFASFWMGLLLQHDKKNAQADQIFQRTAQNSLPGWRVNVHLKMEH